MLRVAFALALVAAAAAAKESTPKSEALLDGAHWRLSTEHGAIHVWRPAHYDRRSAGVVIYLHGWYTDADGAWRDQKLAEQFRDSGQNALFIVPEAPSGAGEAVQWPILDELLTTVFRKLRLPAPPGPLVIAAHSGSYRVVVEWLKDPRVQNVLLIDALYGNEDDFGAWLEDPAHRMTIVAKGTLKWTEPFVAARKYAVTVGELPSSWDELGKKARAAKLLYIKTQVGHMELMTEARALPILLRRSALRRLPSLYH